jgi:hypothetical protein
MNETAFKIERELNVRLNGQHSVEKLSIWDLRKKQKTGDLDECWACSCTFPPICPEVATICGEDPLDAFLNAIWFVRKLIQGHKSIGYQVWWIEEGDDGGL